MLLARITQLTTDPFFYNIANIIVIIFLYLAVLVDVVAVMHDVFASVYNFHSPLSSKVKLPIPLGYNPHF
jgi:hypothetical protein